MGNATLHYQEVIQILMVAFLQQDTLGVIQCKNVSDHGKLNVIPQEEIQILMVVFLQQDTHGASPCKNASDRGKLNVIPQEEIQILMVAFHQQDTHGASHCKNASDHGKLIAITIALVMTQNFLKGIAMKIVSELSALSTDDTTTAETVKEVTENVISQQDYEDDVSKAIMDHILDAANELVEIHSDGENESIASMVSELMTIAVGTDSDATGQVADSISNVVNNIFNP